MINNSDGSFVLRSNWAQFKLVKDVDISLVRQAVNDSIYSISHIDFSEKWDVSEDRIVWPILDRLGFFYMNNIGSFTSSADKLEISSKAQLFMYNSLEELVFILLKLPYSQQWGIIPKYIISLYLAIKSKLPDIDNLGYE